MDDFLQACLAAVPVEKLRKTPEIGRLGESLAVEKTQTSSLRLSDINLSVEAKDYSQNMVNRSVLSVCCQNIFIPIESKMFTN